MAGGRSQDQSLERRLALGLIAGSKLPHPAAREPVPRATALLLRPRTSGPVLVNSRGARMDRHAATRRLRRLAQTARVPIAKPHPHMLRHTFVTTMLNEQSCIGCSIQRIR